MEINCDFTVNLIGYTCKIDEANIIEKDHVIKVFKGIHQNGFLYGKYSHKDVKRVEFFKTTVNHFPRDLQKHFPNITHLKISYCGIKDISKNDLKGLERLVGLRIEKCHLTTLPDDLFTEMPKLEEVSFADNKIEFASSEILKPLIGRKKVKVDLRGNKRINACFESKFGPIKSVEELMKLIDEGCLKPALQTNHPEPVVVRNPMNVPNRVIIPDPANFNPKLKEMWLTGKFSDLMIVAGEKRFKVHKNILGMKSEIFSQIFEDQSEATEIKIPHFSAGAVEALLQFIYTNEISQDENAKENFDIAHKFKVAEMKSVYEKVIGDQINKANAWESFLFAHRFSLQQIKVKSFQQIVKIFPEQVSTKLMDDPEKLKKLIDARKAYEEMLAQSKP